MPLPKAKNNAFYSSTFLIFVTRFFPSLASLLVMIWYSRQLLPAVYGNYQHFWIHLLVFYPFVCLGLHVLLTTYNTEMVLTLTKRVKSRHYIGYLVWAAGCSFLFAILQRDIEISVWLSFLFLLFYSLTFILESLLIVSRNFAALVFVNMTYSVIFCTLHWVALQRIFSLNTLILGLFVLVFMRFVVYGIVLMRYKSQHIGGGTGETDLAKVIPLWRHLGLYDILQVLSGYVDKFVISILLTAESSAIYYNGSQNIPFIPLLLSASGSAVLLQLAKGHAGNERNDTIRLMKQSGRLLSSVVFPLFFFLLFYRTEFMIAIFTEKYRSAVPVFLATILLIPIRAYSFTTILQRQHRGDIINIGAVSELALACALMYPLYKWIGLPGIALSFVISTYLQAAFYLQQSGKLLNINLVQLIPWGNWLIKLIVFGSLFIGIHYVSTQYFIDKIALILGGVIMILAICISLFAELNNPKHGSE